MDCSISLEVSNPYHQLSAQHIVVDSNKRLT